MSTNYKVVSVLDDRLSAESERTLPAFVGPSSETFQKIQANTINTTNPTWTIQPPSFNTGVSRTVYYHAVGSIVLTGTNLDAFTIRASGLAFRQFPLQQMMSSLTVQMNDATLSIGNIQQILPALLRKGLTSRAVAGSLSTTNAGYDMFNSYGLPGNNNTSIYPFSSPIVIDVQSDYASMGRCIGLTSLAVNAGFTQLTIGFDLREPLIVPPFEYGDDANTKSLFGCNNIQINANMTNFHRMLSLNNYQTGAGGQWTLTAPPTLSFTANELEVTYVTGPEGMLSEDRAYLYGFSNIQTWTSNLTGDNPSPYNAVLTGVGQVVDLPVVPRGFLVYATLSDSDVARYQYSLPDVFFPMSSITCQFMTRAGLLAGITPTQLYKMNIRNGVTIPWEIASAATISAGGGTSLAQNIRGSGTVYYIDTASDLSLPAGVTPGMSVRCQFSVTNSTFTNIIPANGALTINNPVLRVIAIIDGQLVNFHGTTQVELGGVDKDVYKQAPIKQSLRSELEKMQRNGGFGGSKFGKWMKKVGTAVSPYVQDAAQAAAKAAIQRGMNRANAYLGGNAYGGSARMDEDEVEENSQKRSAAQRLLSNF